jgi:tetratricopeptide (TPR) repeat protein
MGVTMVGVITPVSALAADLADFLVKPAESALAEHKLGLAVSIWRGVVAIRGEADEAVWKLADAWTLAGEFDAAAEELERYAGAVDDPGKRAAAERRMAELTHRPRGFSGPVFEVVPAEALAREAFRRGRLAFEARRYPDAVALFRAGVEMAPDLPGNYRELGEAYDRLHRGDEATRFFLRYLRLRPLGRNADDLRARLLRAGALGRLSVETSFPCEQVWMNRQPVRAPLPLREMAVAPGRYRVLCYNEKYHFARYLDVDVPRGGKATAQFRWAILENKLQPWGRIVVENPDRAAEMNDVGVWDEIGVPVPEDRRALKVVIRAADGSKRREMLLKLEAGKRVPLAW